VTVRCSPRYWKVYASGLASADVVLDASHLAELDALTTPAFDCPHPFVDDVRIGFHQGDTTINGLTSSALQRS